MKVVIKRAMHDYYERQSMNVDGKHDLFVGALCECPEDAIIGRDLVCCVTVSEYMQRAYDAGKRGEELVIDISELETVPE